MLTIIIILTIAIIAEGIYSVSNFDSRGNIIRSQNYFAVRLIVTMLTLAAIWSAYIGIQASDKLIKEYKKGCPEYEMIRGPIYKLKNK